MYVYIVESGTFFELMERKREFYLLYRKFSPLTGTFLIILKNLKQFTFSVNAIEYFM